MPNIIDNTNSLQIGIQSVLAETWRQQLPVFQEQQDLFLRRLPDTGQRTSEYPWKESLPFPVPWPYGKGRTYQSFKDRKIAISIFPYELTIPFSGWDEEDDQLGDMRSHLQETARRMHQVPDKMIAEYLVGVADLNPNIKNAYDGVQMYSAVDGDGTDRFGVVGGNIIAGSGVSNTAQIIDDLYTAQQRFIDFMDPSGESPIFSPDDCKFENLVVIIPSALNQAFREISKAENLRVNVSNSVSESNTLVNSFEYRINPYLTDNSDYYITLKHQYWKPLIFRGPDNLRQIFADFNNSDKAREYNEYAIHTDVRYGMGPWVPFTTLKVNN